MDATETQYIRTIEWDMMNKRKFYPLSMVSSFTVRCFLYPFTVIKTRIQLQKHNSMYKGTFDAYKKIITYEGLPGLYKGFWINTIQIFSGVLYVTTYENVRYAAQKYADVTDNKVKGLLGGAAASVVSQTIIVPFDVISQHMMVLGQLDRLDMNKRNVINPLNIEFHSRSKFDIAKQITCEVYRRDGFAGFYRGYMASLGTFVPNSAFWWSFYHFYADELVRICPSCTPLLLIQCIAAPLGGVTTSLITNPLDVVRARLQVQRLDSFTSTFHTLWKEERLGIFTKGLSARLVQSVAFSFMIILGYETIKRWSVNEEYKDQIKW